MRYSRRYMALLSPPADTERDVIARKVRYAMSDLAKADVREKYPVINSDNAEAAVDLFDERYKARMIECGYFYA